MKFFTIAVKADENFVVVMMAGEDFVMTMNEIFCHCEECSDAATLEY